MPHRPDDAPATLRELRLLDGPNLYVSRAAAKVVLDVTCLLEGPSLAGAPRSEVRARAVARHVAGLTRQLAAGAGVTRLAVRSRPGPEPGQLTVVFPWRRRGTAAALAVALARVVEGQSVDDAVLQIRAAEPGVSPGTPRPRVPVVAVTGTNGKTTTTRLVAHMSRCAGKVTGWSSTDGVIIDGEVVEEGDWSGYGGAGQVLADARVELAVLETARGGLLLRGAGALWNDVSVVTNVGADHLGLNGVHTVDDLAEVKAVVPRITREGGWCVLNAQDPRVLAMRGLSKGRPWVFSLDAAAPGVRTVLSEGGRATTVLDGQVAVLEPGGATDLLLPLTEVPMTLGGLSRHDTANALAAASAGLAIGLPREAVVEGLRTFGSAQNPGRMNLWDVPVSRAAAGGGVPAGARATVVLDLAHNEDSLRALLAVVRELRTGDGRVWTVLGTAGDRMDNQLRELGYLAARGSDVVVIAEKEKYLRGREPQEMVDLLRDGAGDVPVFPDEQAALRAVLAQLQAGDAVAFMCHADRLGCEQVLLSAGAVAR